LEVVPEIAGALAGLENARELGEVAGGKRDALRAGELEDGARAQTTVEVTVEIGLGQPFEDTLGQAHAVLPGAAARAALESARPPGIAGSASTALESHDLPDAALVASAAERRGEEQPHHPAREAAVHHLGAERQDVGVVVLASVQHGLDVVTQRAARPGDLVRRHG